MNFTIDEYLMYGTLGICKYKGIEKKSFDGVNENEYLKLTPVNSKTSSYYVPKENADTKLRKLIDKETVYSLIDNMSEAETSWCKDVHQRKAMYNTILRSDDYEQLIAMLKSLHKEQKSRVSKGKKLFMADEKAMKTAENMMYQEFSIVLGIPFERVPSFISERIESNNN